MIGYRGDKRRTYTKLSRGEAGSSVRDGSNKEGSSSGKRKIY